MRIKRTDLIKEEYRDSDGYWIYLKPGWQCGDDRGTHGITEYTKRDARGRLSQVIPCDCADCHQQPGFVGAGKLAAAR
jgi:hypothetical protein